ncbi:hypothetical protein BKA93DRAFT_878776 [Sparassis latifolia]
MCRRVTNHRKREGTHTQRRITGANDARRMEGWVFYICIGASQWNAATADLVQRRGLQKPVHVNVHTGVNRSCNEQRVTAFATTTCTEGQIQGAPSHASIRSRHYITAKQREKQDMTGGQPTSTQSLA